MTRNTDTHLRKRALIGLALFLIIIGTMIIYFSMPLWTGTEITLATRPVDPFDLLRGQYMTINYEIGTLPATENMTTGTTIFVTLQKVTAGNQTLWNYTTIGTTRPQEGVFLKGTVLSIAGNTMRVRYGIEQYFFEQGANVPTQNIVVKAKVDGSGNARIIELLQNGTPVNITYRNRP